MCNVVYGLKHCFTLVRKKDEWKEDLRIKSKMIFEKTGNIETEASVLFNRNPISIPTWIHLQNHVKKRVQTRVRNHVQNYVRK